MHRAIYSVIFISHFENRLQQSRSPVSFCSRAKNNSQLASSCEYYKDLHISSNTGVFVHGDGEQSIINRHLCCHCYANYVKKPELDLWIYQPCFFIESLIMRHYLRCLLAMIISETFETNYSQLVLESNVKFMKFMKFVKFMQRNWEWAIIK